MSTLFVKGVTWNISIHNKKPAYYHKNICITWENKTGTWQAKNDQGELILARISPAACIEDTSVYILDGYASVIVPSWEVSDEEEKEIQRDTIPEGIICLDDQDIDGGLSSEREDGQDGSGQLLSETRSLKSSDDKVHLTCSKCSGQGREDHPCPFNEDVNNDSTTLCNCCSECTQNCADDI